MRPMLTPLLLAGLLLGCAAATAGPHQDTPALRTVEVVNHIATRDVAVYLWQSGGWRRLGWVGQGRRACFRLPTGLDRTRVAVRSVGEEAVHSVVDMHVSAHRFWRLTLNTYSAAGIDNWMHQPSSCHRNLV